MGVKQGFGSTGVETEAGQEGECMCCWRGEAGLGDNNFQGATPVRRSVVRIVHE